MTKTHTPEIESAPMAPAGETHAVVNVGRELPDYDAYSADDALVAAVSRYGATSAEDEIRAFGLRAGSADYRALGHLANKYKPELDTHDRFGRRVDVVRYHDAYHALMQAASEERLHSRPWVEPQPGSMVARAAKYVMQGGVEAGHACPITMTFACIPSLRITPSVAERWEAKVLAPEYDARNVPIAEKRSAKIGMGMTEKQGGSDVRANTTVAKPIGAAGPGERYVLEGHKWFLSAPMCDAFLVLAQTGPGLSCFLVPRFTEDGEKNALNVIRLKNKMGNVSNASSEIELRGAIGTLVGEEGRGVPTIIEMVNLTRFDCILGSAGQMRMAVAEATHHCTERAAFGARLVDKPLMRNVLADLQLEYEAALAVAMRMSHALERKAEDPAEALLSRLSMAIGKYWVCKRAPQHAYEAMECIGGSGVMEDGPMPRLYRDAVINPIWEGSGNVQCLDVLRAMGKSPETVAAFMNELERARGGNAILDRTIDALGAELRNPDDLEFRARAVVDRAALALQGALLVQNAPSAIADAFCESRLDGLGVANYGVLRSRSAVDQLVTRATPVS